MNPLGVFDGYFHTLLEVFTALAPLLVFFALFQALVVRRLPANLPRVAVGTVFAMIGLSLFLQGARPASFRSAIGWEARSAASVTGGH